MNEASSLIDLIGLKIANFNHFVSERYKKEFLSEDNDASSIEVDGNNTFVSDLPSDSPILASQ